MVRSIPASASSTHATQYALEAQHPTERGREGGREREGGRGSERERERGSERERERGSERERERECVRVPAVVPKS